MKVRIILTNDIQYISLKNILAAKIKFKNCMRKVRKSVKKILHLLLLHRAPIAANSQWMKLRAAETALVPSEVWTS